MAFDSLDQLLEALELFVDTPAGLITPVQAVAVLNHIKRLSRDGMRKEYVPRVQKCMVWYAGAAQKGIRRLSGKHVALIMNSLRDVVRAGPEGTIASLTPQGVFANIISDSIARLQQLLIVCKVQNDERCVLDSQNIANIVNALASIAVRETSIQELLVSACLRLSPTDFGPQAIANIVNGFARMNWTEPALWEHLAEAALSTDAGTFSTQHVANILNGFQKVGYRHPALFSHMSDAARRLPPREYFPQAVANMLSALAWAGRDDPSLLEHLAGVVRLQGPGADVGVGGAPRRGSWGAGAGAQAVSLMFQSLGGCMAGMTETESGQGFAKARVVDPGLLQSLSKLALRVPVDGFDVQALSGLAGALADTGSGDEALLRHICVAAIAAIDSPSKSLTPKQVTLFASTFSKILNSGQPHHVSLWSSDSATSASKLSGPCRFWVVDVLQKLRRLIEGFDSFSLGLDDIASILSIYLRAGLLDPALITCMSAAVRQLPSDMLDPQSLALIVNAFARAAPDQQALFQHLAASVVFYPCDAFEVSTAAYILNGMARSLSFSDRRRLQSTTLSRVGKQTLLGKSDRKGHLPGLDGFDSDSKMSSNEVGLLKIVDVLQVDWLDNLTIIPNPGLSGEGKRLDQPLRPTVNQSFPLLKSGTGISDQELKLLADFLLSEPPASLSSDGGKGDMRFNSILHVTKGLMQAADESWTSLTAALVLNALARTGADRCPEGKALMLRLGPIILAIPAESFDAQNAGNIVNAFVRSELKSLSRSVLSHMSKAMLLRDPCQISAQGIATLLNGFATARVLDGPLMNHLLLAALECASRFGGAEVATSLHALATLGLESEAWIDVLCLACDQVPLNSWLPEETAMLAWSTAVLRIVHPAMWKCLPTLVDSAVSAMNRNSLSQLHQLFLSVEYDPLVKNAAGKSLDLVRFLEGAKCRVAFESNWHIEVRTSDLQRKVVAEMVAQGWIVVEEVVEPRSGYSVDAVVRLPGADKRQWLVEVDGPYHFVEGSVLPLGKTILKRRHLMAMGFDLISVPFSAWDALSVPSARQAFIRSLLSKN